MGNDPDVITPQTDLSGESETPPEGIIHQLTGKTVFFETDTGDTVWGIQLDVPVSDELRADFDKFTIGVIHIPENIKTIRIISLKPEEMLDASERVIQSNSPKGIGVMKDIAEEEVTGIYRISTEKGLEDAPTANSLHRVITSVTGLDTEYLNYVLKNPINSEADTLLIFDGHGKGKGKKAVIGEQLIYTPVLNKAGENVISPGNSISLKRLLDLQDNPESEIVCVIVNSCTDGDLDLEPYNFPVIYPQGKSTEMNRLNRDYKARRIEPKQAESHETETNN